MLSSTRTANPSSYESTAESSEVNVSTQSSAEMSEHDLFSYEFANASAEVVLNTCKVQLRQ